MNMKELVSKIIEVLATKSGSNELDWDDITLLEEIIGDDNITIESGATKWCIVLNDYDYVLKIPRYGSYSINYCKLEVEKYNKAIAYGVEKILLPTEYLTTIFINGNPLEIYIQAKYSETFADLSIDDYDELEQAVYDSRQALMKDIQDILDKAKEYYRINTVWTILITQLYGITFLRNFIKWINDCRVNDLHNGNYGFKNNKPIIFDYSGFFEDCNGNEYYSSSDEYYSTEE